MAHSTEQKWYVVYTRTRREKNIVNEMNSLETMQGYTPLKTTIKKLSDRVKKVDVALFSNYVFVRSSLQHRLSVFTIPGVLRFVCSEGKPITIDDKQIAHIKLLESNGNDLQLEPYSCIGAKVVIKMGIFAGIQGTLVKKLNKNRLIVKIPLLHQAISVNITDSELVYI